MRIVPLTLSQANEFVAKHHRHHKRVTGHRFSIGLEKAGKLTGICVVGRPVARMTDQYKTAEVTRLCTDGSKNACSKLYGAAARIAREMGFESIQTFILDTEPGTSLIASGWSWSHTTTGGEWGRSTRPRKTEQTALKHKYEKVLR